MMGVFSAPVLAQPRLVPHLTWMRASSALSRRLLLGDFSLARTVLTRDLHAANGKLIAARGEIIDLARLKAVAAKAPREARRRPLHEPPLAAAVLAPFGAAPLPHFVEAPGARAKVPAPLVDVRFH